MTACGGGGGSTPPPPPANYVLTVDSTNPANGVTINYNNPLNNVIIPGTTSFLVTESAGTTLILTAPTTAGGNTFVSWTGCTTATTVTCSVTLNSNSTVTANYTVPTTMLSTVTVNQSSTGPAVTDQILGMNMAVWYDIVANKAGILSAFETAGIKAARWPGGSASDVYHWANNTECDGGYTVGNSTFSNFVNDLAIPVGLDVALTADYGTNAACTGPGDPTEAATWVTNALSLGVTVSHMTVGNEEYGSWETDNHTLKNNAATYAAATAGSSGYYALIKAASPNTLVGVSVNPVDFPGWDPTVLAGAPYDFVEYHYYPETPSQESDTFLVLQAAQELTTNINTIKSELKTAGHPDTPIYVGEIGGPYSNPGKQSWSITQGLYAGQVLGEMMNDGVSRLTWWIGFGNCNGVSGNDSASLYGWQNFGAYNVFSDWAFRHHLSGRWSSRHDVSYGARIPALQQCRR